MDRLSERVRLNPVERTIKRVRLIGEEVVLAVNQHANLDNMVDEARVKKESDDAMIAGLGELTIVRIEDSPDVVAIVPSSVVERV